ncbi:uncharacterized protein LOC116946515 [Petromyzon marinus]|uniref:Uncharacterized protein LOC116946515 n=1 Tax=Petromyzon marinus TaxID=7757 RepID=A0AAJ7X197_PETMA|nr:uncharacterized protein LOC116946515 [Petromyzon marinus]
MANGTSGGSPTLQTNLTFIATTLYTNLTSIATSLYTNLTSIALARQTNLTSVAQTLYTNLTSVAPALYTNLTSVAPTLHTNLTSVVTTLHSNLTSIAATRLSGMDVELLYTFVFSVIIPAAVIVGGAVNICASCVVVAVVSGERVLRERARFVLLAGALVGDMVFTVPAIVTYGMAKLELLMPSVAVSISVMIIRTALFVGVLCIAAMSMELYIAVCLPLRHARLCNLRSAYGCLATTLALGAAPALARLALEILSSASQGTALLLSTVFSNSIQGGGGAASGPGSSVAANGSLQAATGAPALLSSAAQMASIELALNMLRQVPAVLVLVLAYLCVIGSYVLVSKECRRVSQRGRTRNTIGGFQQKSKNRNLGSLEAPLPGDKGAGGKQGAPLESQDAPEDSKNPNRARNTIGIHAVQLTLYLSALYYPYMHGIIDGTVAVQEWRLRYRALVFLLCFVLPRALSPVVHGVRCRELRRGWRKRIGVAGAGGGLGGRGVGGGGGGEGGKQGD